MKSTLLLLFTTLLLSSCLTTNFVKNVSYNGVITRIFDDENNHLVTSFEISTKNGIIVDVADYYPRSWEFASVGDSISKIKGELSITIKKEKGEIEVFRYDN